jgi:hypothetical protein
MRVKADGHVSGTCTAEDCDKSSILDLTVLVLLNTFYLLTF